LYSDTFSRIAINTKFEYRLILLNWPKQIRISNDLNSKLFGAVEFIILKIVSDF